MKNSKKSTLKNLPFPKSSLLQNNKLRKFKGGAKSAEQLAKYDDVKCRNSLRDNGNGDGIW